MNKPTLLTIKECSALVDGLTPYRIRQMCITGELQHIKAGNKYLINKNRLLEIIGENPDNFS
jgi:hypothetical protein